MLLELFFFLQIIILSYSEFDIVQTDVAYITALTTGWNQLSQWDIRFFGVYIEQKKQTNKKPIKFSVCKKYFKSTLKHNESNNCFSATLLYGS